jgi:hypothetical protein
MDGVSFLFGFLAIALLIAIFGMNTLNQRIPVNEGFLDTPSNTAKPSRVETSIRSVLDTMNKPEVCSVFEQLRETMLKNEKAGTSISEEEAQSRVEKQLALAIPGGALPCPLLVYPKKGSSDLEWLDFLQKVPSDFGARVVFMAVYAMTTLGKQESKLKAVLAGEKVPDGAEGFATICPPDIANSRRAEKKAKDLQNCMLPEDIDPKTIEMSVQELLKNLVSMKIKLLKQVNMDPEMDIQPMIQKAKESAAFLKQKQAEAEEGTLRPEMKSD